MDTTGPTRDRLDMELTSIISGTGKPPFTRTIGLGGFNAFGFRSRVRTQGPPGGLSSSNMNAPDQDITPQIRLATFVAQGCRELFESRKHWQGFISKRLNF